MKHADLSPIPAVETATDPIHSAADLRQRWRALMGPLGFGERLLRFVIVGTDRRFITILIDVMIPDVPDRERVATAMAALAELLAEHEPGATVAVLLTGPGRGRVSETDRAWAALVSEVAAVFEVPIEPFFRANDESLVQVAPAA